MNAKGVSVEEIYGLGYGENKLFKESFMCLSNLRGVLAKLSLLGGRISKIQTKNARVSCRSISCAVLLEAADAASSLRRQGLYLK